jgi:hypothetical protein
VVVRGQRVSVDSKVVNITLSLSSTIKTSLQNGYRWVSLVFAIGGAAEESVRKASGYGPKIEHVVVVD